MSNARKYKWNDELICNELMRVQSTLGIETMPTHSEIYSVCKNNSLIMALVHYGGTKKFAKLINAEVKECESEFGDKYEIICSQEISDKFGYLVKKMKPRYPYDLLVDGSVKVDSKVGKLYINNKKKVCFYTFNLEKKNPTCDVFVCYCLNNMEQIVKTLVIPSAALSGKSQLSVGINSVYDKYIDNWDLIQKMVEFNRSRIM